MVNDTQYLQRLDLQRVELRHAVQSARVDAAVLVDEVDDLAVPDERVLVLEHPLRVPSC